MSRKSALSDALATPAANATLEPLEPSLNLDLNGHTYNRGSFACRRGLLSLTYGLFTGMLEVVIGLAYLAVMGVFGLIAVIAVFGFDDTFFALAPFVPGITAPNIASVTTAISDRAGEILDMILDSSVAQAFFSAASQGAEQAVVDQGIDAVKTDALTAFGDALESAMELLRQHSQVILVASTVVAVMFGVWGLLRLWNSFDSPFDCQSGYVTKGRDVVCHPALRFGEAVHKPCPGHEDALSQVAFICSERNHGIVTFTETCPLD